jgi:hypothetical protein
MTHKRKNVFLKPKVKKKMSCYEDLGILCGELKLESLLKIKKSIMQI